MRSTVRGTIGRAGETATKECRDSAFLSSRGGAHGQSAGRPFSRSYAHRGRDACSTVLRSRSATTYGSGILHLLRAMALPLQLVLHAPPRGGRGTRTRKGDPHGRP